ncbi:hypothetical protein GCM10023149_45810 [Mucilaginibacter gynuensis]|uniref:Uncharacterized protein n=1 Tax=Mucilaginibacter gynuensis TaxID=1302236 RepID=A0ABP8HBQ0_9SPHI
MRKFLQQLLRRTVSKLADKYSSRPDKRQVNYALNKLLKKMREGKGYRGSVIQFNPQMDKFIILSDQHVFKEISNSLLRKELL